MKRDRAPRQQKTTEQWMALEAAYLMDNYPSDDQYKKLGSNLQLTPMQVREWFCKRRKKSKVEEAAGAEDQQPNQESGQAPANGAVQARKRRRTRSGSSASQGESNRSVLAVRVIAAAKELLLSQDFQYRDEGPPLALFFDKLPASRGRRQSGGGRQSKRQELSRLLSRVREEERARKREEIDLRKREQEAIRRQKAAEKEAERAMKMQLKLEMLERKELERQQRAQEKLEKERELQELRRLREEEKAKARIAKQMMREEMMRRKEEEKQERKRLREFERMKAAEERAAAKLLQEQRKQILEDDELEREEIAAAMQKKYLESAPEGTTEPMDIDREKIELPPFPPKDVETIEVFDATGIAASGMDKQLTPQVQQDLLMVWKFIRDYSFVINVKSVPLGELVGCIALGVESKYLADLHMSMLKLLLADVEESHSLVNQEDGMEHKGGQLSGLDRVVHNFSRLLGEIWEWHFGSDLLRAQRNYLTWPEVLRQFLVILGYGPERPKIRKKKAKAVETKGGSDAGPKMNPPATCRPGTIKGAAWTILAEAGTEGMTAADITAKIDELGLRTMAQGSRTPEASVNGALARDSFVFEKKASHKYALRVICSWHRRQAKLEKEKAEKGQEGEDVKKEEDAGKEEKADAVVKMEVDGVKSEEGSPAAKSDKDGDNEEEEEEEEEDEGKPRRLGESWVRKLGITEYNKLTLHERTQCLVALCNAVLESPSLYQQIEAAMREKDVLARRLREGQREVKRLRNATSTAATAGGNGTPDGKNANDQEQTAAEQEEDRKAMEEELESLVVDMDETAQKLQLLIEEINRMPLGVDRRFNRYWYLKLSQDKKDAMFLIEDAADHSLKMIKDKEALDLLVSKLNPRGLRESKLIKALEKRTQDILAALPAQSCKITLPKSGTDFMTDYPTEAHSISLKDNRKPTSSGIDYKTHPQTFLIEKLKGDMLDIYQALPSDSFEDEEWDGPGVWMAKVKSATKAYDLRDILGELEGAIKDKLLDHDHFNRNPRIVPGAWVPRDAFDEDEEAQAEQDAQELDEDEEEEDEDGMIGYIASEGDVSWLPPTTSALQYRLRCLDASITFRRSIKPMCVRIDAYKYIQRDNPLNKDGTNFTVISATGQIKVMQNYSRDRSRNAFPTFPEKVLTLLASDFMISYQDFQKQFRKIGFEFSQGGMKYKSKDRAAKNKASLLEDNDDNDDDNDDPSDDEFYVGTADSNKKAKSTSQKIEETDDESSD